MKEVAEEIATRSSHILFHLGVELEGLIPFLNGWSHRWGNRFGDQSYIIRLVGIQSQAWNHSEGTSRCDPKGVGNEALSAS